MFSYVPVLAAVDEINVTSNSSQCLLYSNAPKSVTTFNLFTFFSADLIQSKAVDSLQLTSDWINSARKNVYKLKVVTLLGALL